MYILDHFHVHIVNTNYQGGWGLTIGQAHLLDDIISLVSTANVTSTHHSNQMHSLNLTQTGEKAYSRG